MVATNQRKAICAVIFLSLLCTILSSLLLNISAASLEEIPAEPNADDNFTEETDIGPLYATTPPVHQWIALQAYKKLSSGSLQTEMSEYLPTSSNDAYYSPGFDTSGWDNDDDAPYAKSKALIEGAWEEDRGYADLGVWRFDRHFWSPDGGYNNGLLAFDSALKRAQEDSGLWSDAINAYNEGTESGKTFAYYRLGRVAHLLMDMSVPAHTLLDLHPWDDAYEIYTAEDERYKNITSTDAIVDNIMIYNNDPTEYDHSLSDLFYTLAEKTDDFDSDDYNGEVTKGVYRCGRNALNASKTLSRAELHSYWGIKRRDLIKGIDYKDYAYNGSYYIYYYEGFYTTYSGTTDKIKVFYTDGTSAYVDFAIENANSDIFEDILGGIYQPELEARAIGYVAALYQLFWERTHPTVTVTVNTSPSGKNLNIKVDGTDYTDSQTFIWDKGLSHTIEAPVQQTGGDGKSYTFQYWSDGGSREHVISPTSDDTITAVYGTGEQISLIPAADTYVDETEPDENFGGDDVIIVSGEVTGSITQGLIKFDVSSIPADTVIDSVELKLLVEFYWVSYDLGDGILLREIQEDWQEKKITYNDWIGISRDPIVAVYVNQSPSTCWTWKSSDHPKLKTLVEKWIRNPSSNYGIALQPDFRKAGVLFFSREYSDYNYKPRLIVIYGQSPSDTFPPSPNPMNWETKPYATGQTSIKMVATTANDSSGVEYYFEETSGNPGGSNSGWQDDTTYEDTGLQPGTTYTYQVKARDKSSNRNETNWSVQKSARTYSPTEAEFTCNSDGGYPPLTVHFTDQSTGDISSWWWDFGDGILTSDRHPSHTYNTTGCFTVSLTVSGPGGSDIETKPEYIHVLEPTAPDLYADRVVNFLDLALLAEHWMEKRSDLHWDESVDLDWSGRVDFMDLYYFGQKWLSVYYKLSTNVIGWPPRIGYPGGIITPSRGTYEANTVVILTAEPPPGFFLKAWSGTDDDSSTENTNTVTMDSDKTVAVIFEPILRLLINGEILNDSVIGLRRGNVLHLGVYLSPSFHCWDYCLSFRLDRVSECVFTWDHVIFPDMPGKVIHGEDGMVIVKDSIFYTIWGPAVLVDWLDLNAVNGSLFTPTRLRLFSYEDTVITDNFIPAGTILDQIEIRVFP